MQRRAKSRACQRAIFIRASQHATAAECTRECNDVLQTSAALQTLVLTATLLPTEAVDQPHIEPPIVLKVAPKGCAEIVRRDAEGEVRVDVHVEVRSDGEGRLSVGRWPKAELGSRDSLGVAVEFADSRTTQREGTD